MYRSSTWSPMGDQPRKMYTLEVEAVHGIDIGQLEYAVPGTMVYGHYNGRRTWLRWEKMLEHDEYRGPPDYVKIHAHGTCVYLAEDWLDSRDLHPSAIEVSMDSAVPLSTDFDLEESNGNIIIANLVKQGLLKPEAERLITPYQARYI